MIIGGTIISMHGEQNGMVDIIVFAKFVMIENWYYTLQHHGDHQVNGYKQSVKNIQSFKLYLHMMNL